MHNLLGMKDRPKALRQFGETLFDFLRRSGERGPSAHYDNQKKKEKSKKGRLCPVNAALDTGSGATPTAVINQL